MKHHGMLFADRLMPPLLDGSKTQTRRPVNPQPEHGVDLCHWSPTGWAMKDADGACRCKPIRGYHVGDLIWARECWGIFGGTLDEDWIWYRADLASRSFTTKRKPGRSKPVIDPEDIRNFGGVRETLAGHWRPSIHMPKWACRCWLEITDVRVQRIQEIGEEDAIAEGVIKLKASGRLVLTKGAQYFGNTFTSARDAFASSWDSIYPGSWERNDWTWALTFRRVDAPAPPCR